MEASAPLSNIPNEIIRHILLQLPMKSVIRCQCVCKQWRSLIDSSDFKLSYRGQGRLIILSHESKSPYDWSSRFLVKSTSHDLGLQSHKWPFGESYPLIRASGQYSVRALCSCNGFVLLLADRDILLWNPSTRCSTKVLESPYPEIKNLGTLAGLCYDSCTRDYKAVLLLRPIKLDHNFGSPFVISASLKHKQWRPVKFPYKLDSARGGVEFRNTFHWWASDIKCWDWVRDYLSGADRNRIVYFDPMRDEFRILPTPKLSCGGGENSIVGLGVINDCLSMACILHKEEEPKTKTMQVLIMKEYGIQESWITAFAIQMHEITDTYGLTFYSQKKNTQEVLFLRMGWYRRHAYVYDWKKDELKEVLMDFLDTSGLRYIDSMFFCVESLACPSHIIN